VEEAFAIAEET
jgi:hypothetical protein